jgi:predicted N-acetyltransferase YhbS
MSLSHTALAFKTEQPADAPAIDALLDHAFGPGRFTKVSERVREFAAFRPDLSVLAWDGDRLVGCCRQSLVGVGGRAVIFLGPLAVDADARLGGVGGALVERACAAAQGAGYPIVLLVGDEPYFQRFGFSADRARGVVMPGPVDQRRVLARGAAEPLSGPVQAPA